MEINYLERHPWLTKSHTISKPLLTQLEGRKKKILADIEVTWEGDIWCFIVAMAGDGF